MAEIIFFTPKSAVTADENLRGSVDMCRDQLTVFGVDLLFDEITWDVTESVHIKGHGNKRFRITFSNLATVDSAAPSPMKEPCLSFAKAYVRYMQGMRPTKVISNRLASLRALEAALGENGVEPDPVRVDAAILNRAAQLITDRFSRAAAYRVGGQLELLAAFMSTNRLTSVPTTNWRSPIQRPIDTVRVGKEFDERRANKMPSAAALEALPKIFRLATEPGDVVVSSVAAILCSAPDRINEVLLLPVDCEVRQPREGEGDAYGLRWWPAKGADPMVKWVIPSFASVVAEAVAKLRARSEPARDVARWYENHPDKIYLPGRLERFRCRQYLGMDELGEVLWDGAYGKAAPNQWCKANSIPLTDDGSKPCVRFRDVERVCLEALPLGFPILNSETGLKYSDALLVTRRNEFNADKATFRGVIQGVTIARIADGLGARAQHGFRSVFDKFEFTDNGSPIKVTTHQFRHYLNTLAQAGGMSQLDIAKWSGRKDISQNAAYDHETPQQLVAKLRAAIGDEQQMFGPLAEMPKNILISRDEFARLKIPTAHTTDFGYCVHDYTMSPCQLHLDCINCEEHVCVKGDESKAAMLHERLHEARVLLVAAEHAAKEEYMGADRWIVHHSATVERLSQLCAIMDDPQVPGGAVIQLSNLRPPSRIGQAVEERAALGLPDDSQLALLSNAMGGLYE